MLGFTMEDKSVGRRSLSDVKMNPAVFLHLAGQHAKAKRNGTPNKLGFNENQLFIAFTKYLRDEHDQKRRGERLDGDALKEIAKGFIRNASKKYDQQNPNQKKAKPTDKQKRAAETLRQNGWEMEEDELPSGLQSDQDFGFGDPLEMMDHAETATELLSIARDLGPAVAAGIAVVAIKLNDSPETRLNASQLLIGKYDDETGTPESKEGCLLGIGEVMKETPEQKIMAPQLMELATKEENPVLQAQILQLAQPDNSGEDAAAINNFADNSLSVCHFSGRFEEPPVSYAPQMTVVHDARQTNKNNPFYLDPTPQPPWEKRA
jgi:hypothetical protein